MRSDVRAANSSGKHDSLARKMDLHDSEFLSTGPRRRDAGAEEEPGGSAPREVGQFKLLVVLSARLTREQASGFVEGQK